jgi:hypothetical protein
VRAPARRSFHRPGETRKTPELQGGGRHGAGTCVRLFRGQGRPAHDDEASRSISPSCRISCESPNEVSTRARTCAGQARWRESSCRATIRVDSDGGVNVVGQRHIDIDDIPVGNSAHFHLTGDEVKNRGVTGQGPPERAPNQPCCGGCKRQVEDRDQSGIGQQGRRPS